MDLESQLENGEDGEKPKKLVDMRERTNLALLWLTVGQKPGRRMRRRCLRRRAHYTRRIPLQGPGCPKGLA